MVLGPGWKKKESIGHTTGATCCNHMGVSLNGGTPETPQNDHF